MRQLINYYIRNCYTCSRAKLRRHAKYRVLKLSSVLSKTWRDLLVNFVIGLLKSIEYNAIMIYVNRLTKMRHFVSTINEITAKGTANLFINNVYRLHGFPDIVVSDCHGSDCILVYRHMQASRIRLGGGRSVQLTYTCFTS